MSTRTGIWAVNGTTVTRIDRARVQLEIDLEEWIESNPALLAEGLTVIARQLHVAGGFIDLLAIDVRGRLVVIELKRDRLYRDAVVQAIDYAASLRSMEPEELADLVAAATTGVTADGAGGELSDALDVEGAREVTIIVAGAGVDAGLERVVSFLAGYDVPIRVVAFEVFQLPSGERLLVREVIDDDVASIPRTSSTSRNRTVEEIGRLAHDPATTAAFTRIVRAAEEAGLFVRPYVQSVMITPPHQRHRFLMAIRPDGARGLRMSHGPEAFAEFFPELTAGDVEDLIGSSKSKAYNGAALEERATLLETFFAELPTPTPDDEDGPRADGATVIPLAALIGPGEWTSYGELSKAAIGRSSAAMAVGMLARSQRDFPNAHRVLNARGAIPAAWRADDGSGPDVCRARLEEEGVTFDSAGTASPAQRLDAAELVARRGS